MNTTTPARKAKTLFAVHAVAAKPLPATSQAAAPLPREGIVTAIKILPNTCDENTNTGVNKGKKIKPE